MGHDRHTVAVLAPIISLSVTIELNGDDQDEVHLHPAGQGFWTARMLRHLGERPLLCGPIGGESGRVIRSLLPLWGIDVSPVEADAPSMTTINDRRSGERRELAQTPHPRLDRHALDDVYSSFLDHAMTAGIAVITGQTEEVLPLDAYKRLGHDLNTTDVKVVGDLHGEELRSLLAGGPIDFLKVSDENLAEDGVALGDDDSSAFGAIDRLIDFGASNVVLSRAGRPALAVVGGRAYAATPPELDAADTRGAGDSMTAGLAASVRSGSSPEETLKLACGAGAANVTRHGLGSTAEGLFERLAEQVEVKEVARTPS